jgi:hypothetical protein
MLKNLVKIPSVKFGRILTLTLELLLGGQMDRHTRKYEQAHFYSLSLEHA